MTIQEQKQRLRQEMLASREALSETERSACNAAITARLTSMPEYQCARIVLGYMNFGHEYASELWGQQVLADGKTLVLPKTDPATKLLDLYEVQDLDRQLAPGAWGIREPIVELCTRVFSPDGLEFVLLPGVAFTREGTRLGYGGGYYDRLLAGLTHRPPLVAAAFSIQVVQQLPQEATDRRVDWLVTEKEALRCA